MKASPPFVRKGSSNEAKKISSLSLSLRSEESLKETSVDSLGTKIRESQQQKMREAEAKARENNEDDAHSDKDSLDLSVSFSEIESDSDSDNRSFPLKRDPSMKNGVNKTL